jgi:hypothetical protein
MRPLFTTVEYFPPKGGFHVVVNKIYYDELIDAACLLSDATRCNSAMPD